LISEGDRLVQQFFQRSAFRNGDRPGGRDSGFIGFRVVCCVKTL
jgi:hypothetical protein